MISLMQAVHHAEPKNPEHVTAEPLRIWVFEDERLPEKTEDDNPEA